MVRLPVPAALLAITLFALPAAGPAVAQTAQDPTKVEQAQRLMLDGLQRFMQGMMALVDAIPQYQAPEILPNGDIIIRRVPPKDGAAKTQ
jgi:hypothetical protein